MKKIEFYKQTTATLILTLILFVFLMFLILVAFRFFIIDTNNKIDNYHYQVQLQIQTLSESISEFKLQVTGNEKEITQHIEILYERLFELENILY